MRSIRKISLALAIVCTLTCGCSVFAAEVDCDATYCFSTDDFSEKEKVNFTMTLSADVELASDEIKQLF